MKGERPSLPGPGVASLIRRARFALSRRSKSLWRLAGGAKWAQGTSERALLEAIHQQLSHGQRAKVAIFGGHFGATLAGILRKRYQRLQIIVLDPQATASDTHIQLCRSTPYHLIIDVSESSAAMQIDRFQRSFMHLRRNGSYLVRRVISADNSTGHGLVAGLDLAGALRLAADTRLDPTSREEVRDLANLGASIASVEPAAEGLLVQNKRQAWPILRDHELNPILDARPEIGGVIESRNGGPFRSRCDYHDSREFFDWDGTFSDSGRALVFDVPPLHLRRYVQPTCARGQIVESRGLLMPDTYRHHRNRRLVNCYVNSVAAYFGELGPSVRDPAPLEGAFFHLDSEWPGHFGHTLSEQLSRLWAYDQAKKLEPELKLLTTLPANRPNQALQAWETALLGTHGIEADDVFVYDRAVRPSRLYAATPMFSCPEYVHPDIIETWDRIGRSLRAQALSRPRAKRIFCSRHATQKSRPCRNSSDVESFFAQHGFLIVYPEDHDMAEQVTMFQAADVVAGFGGSGLFTMAFCETPKTIIVITPTSYTARNEYLFASVRGHRLRVVWTTPDIDHPPGAWTAQAFASSFAFDFDCEGIYLRQLLADLDD